MRRPGTPRSPSRERTRPSGPAYDAAVRYLGPRPRSVLEVRRHLSKKRYDEREAADAIRRLREQGYLDDAAFARFWLEQRARFRPKGEVALRSELRAKGVDAATVDAVLAESAGEGGEAEAALRALEPRVARWRALDDRERKAKAQAFLRRRGFSFDVIEEVLARI